MEKGRTEKNGNRESASLNRNILDSGKSIGFAKRKRSKGASSDKSTRKKTG